MGHTLKTNSTYAYLAYRKAIIQHTVNYLMTDVLGVNGTEPKHKIFSDEVFHVDSEVPHDEIQQYVEELQEKEAHINTEMNKFEFTKKADGEDGEKQKAKKGGVKSPKGSGEEGGQE